MGGRLMTKGVVLVGIPEWKITRAQLLRDEGMPASWIGEDLDLSPQQVLRVTVGLPGAAAGWKQAWSQIHRHPDLLALHQEFAPRASRRT